MTALISYNEKNFKICKGIFGDNPWYYWRQTFIHYAGGFELLVNCYLLFLNCWIHIFYIWNETNDRTKNSLCCSFKWGVSWYIFALYESVWLSDNHRILYDAFHNVLLFHLRDNVNLPKKQQKVHILNLY